MTRASMRGYVEVMLARYSPASKKDKGDVLGKFTKVTGRHRQMAVRPSHDGHCPRRIDGFMELLLKRGIVTTNVFPYNFAHMLIPHDPYVFDRDGNYLTATQSGKRTPEVNFVDHVVFANKQAEALIDQLLSASEIAPIIILQADEGPHIPRGTDRSSKWNAASEEELLAVKARILNAYYLPGVKKDALYQSISPVNSFRVLFNLYFNTNLELLPDKVYGHEQDRPYAFCDITDKVR